jgi:hypothetical protein
MVSRSVTLNYMPTLEKWTLQPVSRMPVSRCTAREFNRIPSYGCEIGDVDVAGSLGDEIHDARGARHAEHERVRALQGLDALLVLDGRGDHARGGQSAIEAIVGKEVQLDAANGNRVVRRAPRVCRRHARDPLDRFRVALLRCLLERVARGHRLGHRQRLVVAELLGVVRGLHRLRRGHVRIGSVQIGGARDLRAQLIAHFLRPRAEGVLAVEPPRKHHG